MHSFTRALRRVEPPAESLRSEQDVEDAYRRYGDELFGYALSSPGNRALAEDVVQEALQRLSGAHRHVVVEVHYHRRTCAEVAAVRSRLYYGVRALRLILEENGWHERLP